MGLLGLKGYSEGSMVNRGQHTERRSNNVKDLRGNPIASRHRRLVQMRPFDQPIPNILCSTPHGIIYRLIGVSPML